MSNKSLPNLIKAGPLYRRPHFFINNRRGSWQKCLCFLSAMLISISGAFAQVNWAGGVSADFWASANWNPGTFNPATPGANVVTIGSGGPNNPLYTGGSSATNRRFAKLNTLTGAQLTVRGILYANGNDMLNGDILVERGSDFNIRANASIGVGATGIITVTGGSFNVRNTLFLGSNAGGNAILNIWGGKVNAGTNLVVGNNGATGSINFKGPGNLFIAGNKVALFQDLVNTGKMTAEGGKEIEIVYSASTNSTFAGIKQDPNSLLKEYSDYIVLENDKISVSIEKGGAHVISYKYKGYEMSGDIYYSMDGGSSYSQPSNCEFSVKMLSNDIADISLKSVWTPGRRAQAFDIDVHFVLERGASGIYTYAILNHSANYPKTSVGEWRMVWKLNQDQVERLYVDSLRNTEMPSAQDFASAQPTGIAEAVKLTTGVKAGLYECKYNYSTEYWGIGTYGHASNKNKIGSWLVFGGYDFFNDGPTKQDLAPAQGIIHVHFGMNHYNASSTTAEAGQQWSKIYGPYLLYVNSNEIGADALWADAKAKAVEEESKWPYAWLTNTPEYPADSTRGTASGKFTVTDPFKPEIKGAGAMIGLTAAGVDWQFDSNNYQYWAKADANGNFTIPHVRPGTYTLHAFIKGEVGEFAQENVVVNAGQSINLGELTWEVARNDGKMIWEIGIPDRTAKEYKFGDQYFQPFMWEKYSKELPNPIVYTVGESDWSKDLNYVHSAYQKSDGTFGAWPWKINFNIASLAETGNTTLTFAFAGSDHARIDLYLNNETKAFSNFYPPAGGGNALVRQGIHAKYAIYTLKIPVSRLKIGANTITIVQGRASNFFDHVMYDYLSFEAPENSIPVASFTATPTSGYSPLAVSFDASASSDADGVALKYTWDFGDGTIDSVSVITHTYTTPGDYIARLIVTDTRGASDTTSVTINSFNNAPVASFSAVPTSGLSPLIVSFDASASVDADNDSLSYTWDFGDGTTASEKAINHTYSFPGTYTAMLIVADTRNGSDTASVTINSLNNIPFASFTATPASGYAPLSVSFDASASIDSDNDSLSYSWDFGDGSAASEKVVSHTYTGPGSFLAILTVSDTRGGVDSDSILINAESGLKAQYRARINEINPTDNHIKPHLQIVNTSNKAIPYSELSLKYWYTNEGNENQVFWCDYAFLGTNKVNGKFVPLANPASDADHYLEVSFTSTGSIAPGGNSGEIQTRFNKANWSNFNEVGDYSYDPTKTSYQDWNKVTLYRNGILFWGVEPSGANLRIQESSFEVTSFSATLSPNPVQNETNLKIYSAKKDKFEIRLTDITGRTIVNTSASVEAGESKTISISMASGSKEGIYILKVINSENKGLNKKVIKF